MLFDLRTGKRRRMVQIVYSFLAASFLIGFVIFGIGSGGVGSVSDLFGSGSGGRATDQYDDQIEKAQAQLQRDPKDKRALLTVAKYEYLKGNLLLGAPDPTTGQPELTDEALTEYGIAVDAWNDYLKVAGAAADVDTAQLVVNAFVSLQAWDGAARTQELVAQDKPSANTYGTLAIYLYFDGQFAAGDEARDKALAEARSSDRQTFAKQLADFRKDAKAFAKQQRQAGQAASAGAGPSPLDSPFGGATPVP